MPAQPGPRSDQIQQDPSTIAGDVLTATASGQPVWIAPVTSPTAVEVTIGQQFESSAASYEVAARFLFQGSNTLGTPTTIRFIGGVNPFGTQGDFRLFDFTNGLAIAEIIGVNQTSPLIIDLGVISNIPTGPAIFEIQLFRSLGGGGARAIVCGASLEF